MKATSKDFNNRPLVLAIGGFDPCGGAGVIADCKTIESLGGMGMAVNTAQTIQNDFDFKGVYWNQWQIIEEQLSILCSAYHFTAVKIGLVESFDILKRIVEWLKNNHEPVPIVWDPVLKASAGFDFHSAIDHKVKEEVLKNITLITPNLDEAKVLFTMNEEEITDKQQGNILLKGGHSKENRGTDALYADGLKWIIQGDTFEGNPSKHGTGCILSSAIATHLAKGKTMVEACRAGKQFVEKRILSNPSNLATY